HVLLLVKLRRKNGASFNPQTKKRHPFTGPMTNAAGRLDRDASSASRRPRERPGGRLHLLNRRSPPASALPCSWSRQDRDVADPRRSYAGGAGSISITSST